MPSLHHPHHLYRLTRFARLVLAWFVLSLGVAVASPLVKPQSIFLVCSGSGAMKVLVQTDDGSTHELAASTMDCPLCQSAGAPPASTGNGLVPVASRSYVRQTVAVAPLAWRSAASLPARGPPVL